MNTWSVRITTIQSAHLVRTSDVNNLRTVRQERSCRCCGQSQHESKHWVKVGRRADHFSPEKNSFGHRNIQSKLAVGAQVLSFVEQTILQQNIIREYYSSYKNGSYSTVLTPVHAEQHIMCIPVVASILIFPCDDDSRTRCLAVLLQSHVQSEQIFSFLECKKAPC